MTKIITLSILSISVLPQLCIAKVTAPAHHQAALNSSITKLRSLVINQQYEEAYSYAQILAPPESGNPSFDFLYGKAALYSNHPSEAVFALERAHSANPKDPNITIELGNAYLKLKDLNSAETACNTIKTDPQAKPYLEKINILKDQRRTSKFLKYEIASGYDNNIDGLFKFGFPTGKPSWFNNFSLRPGFTRKLKDDRSAIFGFVALRYRPTYNVPRLSVIETNATGGYTTRLKDFRINIPVHVAYMSIGSQPFANNVGIVGEISKPLDKKRVNVLTGSIDFEDFEYPRTSYKDLLVTEGIEEKIDSEDLEDHHDDDEGDV